jgi:peptidoglycan/LPS O-acetylase OafA/YrhL
VAATWAGLAAALVAAFTFTATTKFPGYAVALPVLGTAVAIGGGAVHSERSAGRVLGLRPLQYLGHRSYSMYLWHWPVLILAAGYAGHALSVGDNLLLLLASLAISALTYKFLEDPIRSSARLRHRRPILSIGLGLLFVAVAFGSAEAGLATHRPPPYHPPSTSNLQFP